jgi:hypothetical protein
VTPTVRSLTRLRRLGWQAAPVGKWLPHAGVRVDLWGFGDILADHPRGGLFLIVQSTTASHVAHRLAMAKQRPELAACPRAGGRLEVHGWEQRDGRWFVRVVAVQREDLADVVLAAPLHRRRRKNERKRDLFDGVKL